MTWLWFALFGACCFAAGMVFGMSLLRRQVREALKLSQKLQRDYRDLIWNAGRRDREAAEMNGHLKRVLQQLSEE